MSPSLTSPTADTSLSLEQAIEHFLADLPEETARHIRLVSGIDSPPLRSAYAESPRVPALLLDTRSRFELDLRIQDFIDTLAEDPPITTTVTHLHWQLQLWGLELIWPTTCVLQVYDPPGTVAAEYGPDLSPNLPRIAVTRAHLLDGTLWSSVLAQMSAAQGEQLLEGKYLTVDTQLAALKRRVMPLLLAHRQAIFDRVHAERQHSDDPLVNLLRQQFPQLSKAAAIERLASSSTRDLEAMSLTAGELSDEQLRDIHWYLQEERLNRAYEGLFLKSGQHQDDSLRLMLHSLTSLPGWPSDGVRLELREQAVDGPLLAGVGEPGARQRLVILRHPGHFTLAVSATTATVPMPDLPSVLVALPEPLRTQVGLTDRKTVQRLLQHAVLPRDHLRALLEIPVMHPPRNTPDNNAFLQAPATSFVSPDQIAQRQRELFDALAATNGRTLMLAQQQPNFHWVAALLLGRQLKQDRPLAKTWDPDEIHLNTYEQTRYWPLSDTGERGEEVIHRAITQSNTLTEVFTEHLAGNRQTVESGSNGLYGNATDTDDEQRLAGLDPGGLATILDKAGKDFDTQFITQLDSFWRGVKTLLKDNLQQQIRLEAQLRALDLTLDESSLQDLERVLDHPAHALRLANFPVGGTIHVYRVILQPQNVPLEGCLAITRSPDDDTYKLPAQFYQVGRGLEQFPTFQALKHSLAQRFADDLEGASLLELLPRRHRTWNATNAPDLTAPFSYRDEPGDPWQALVEGLLAKQQLDFTDTWRFAKGAPNLNNDVGEFARQLDEAIGLPRCLDIVPVLVRRNRDLMFGDLLTRVGQLTAHEQTRLADLWRPTLKPSPVPAALGDLPALKANATGLLKAHLQQHYPQASIDPDTTEVQITHTPIYPSPAWQSQPPITVNRRRSLSLTALALENVRGTRLGETVTFKARVNTAQGTPLNLSNEEIKAIVRAVDAPGRYKALLSEKLLGPDQPSLRSEWIEGVRAQVALHAYIAHLSGDLLDTRDSPLQRGYRRIEHLLKHPDARKRPPLDGHDIHANYLMLGGTGDARNGMTIDEVVVISTTPATTLLFLAPLAPDGKALREVADQGALESLLRQPGWKDYCIPRAARNEQWDPAQLFARQFPRVRYFPIEGDLFITLFEARVKHVIASVEYFGASNRRVDREALWYWINAGLRMALEVILGVVPLQLSLPAYLLRGLYGLANASQALATGHGEEAAEALIQTLLDAAAPLPLQPLRPLLRQASLIPAARLPRLVRTARAGQDGLQPPLLAEPSTATPLRSSASELVGYEVRTLPELDYAGNGLFVDRASRLEQYVQLEGQWYRTGTRVGKRYVLKEKNWAEDIELVQVGRHWQPRPKGRLLGGAPDPVGAARYEVPPVHRSRLEDLIRSTSSRIDPNLFSPAASQQERLAVSQVHRLTRQVGEDARRFFSENPVRPPRTLAPDLLDAGSPAQLIERGYHNQNGIVLGAPYDASGGRRFLIDNMSALATEHQVKTLYLDNLLTDFDQVHLNDFHRTGLMSPRLRETLRRLDLYDQIDPAGSHALYDLVRHARANGIRVQALDSGASYRLGLRGYNPDRARALKYMASQIIAADQLQQGAHRWVALVEDTHASPLRGEPGLADLLGAVSMRTADVGGELLPIRVQPDPGAFTQGRFRADTQFVRGDVKLEVNVASQALPAPRHHRNLLINSPGSFLIEPQGPLHRVVFSDPYGTVFEVPARQGQRPGPYGDLLNTVHVEPPGDQVRGLPRLAMVFGTRFKNLDDLIWGLRSAELRHAAELPGVLLHQPRLETHPQLTHAGMFLVETSPQGPVLVNRSRDRSLGITPIRVDIESGRFYIQHERWGFNQTQLFASIDELTQKLVSETGLVRVIESTDL